MKFLNETSYLIEFKSTDLDGATYFLPAYALHRPACQAFAKGKYYEPDTHRIVAYILKAFPGNMVHAGTFFGDMLPSFSRSCGIVGKVYAFEPLLENYVLARLTVDRNNLGNVLLFNSGLGDQLAPCRISRGSTVHSGGASSVSEKGDTTSTIVTIDSLSLTQLSILQLDVEGFELPALHGASRTVLAHRPLVLLEDNNNNCAALMDEWHYQKAGKIRGLDIWCPTERADLLDAVKAFLQKIQA